MYHHQESGMKKKILLFILLSVFVYLGQRIVCVITEPDLPMHDGLFIQSLENLNVKLVCSSTLPKDAVLACSAGFTSQWNFLNSIDERISNSYTMDGVFHEKMTDNKMGTFTFYNNHFYIKRGSPERELRKAAQNGGMGFQQWIIIANHKKRYIKHPGKPNHYRVLAEIKGKLFFIEAAKAMNYDVFLEKLMQHKVKNAIYLDCGPGWETYSLRLNGKQHSLRNTWYPFPFRTNYVIFY